MNILFFGSHHYSLNALESLYKAGHHLVAVFTQPDRPTGRHQELTPTPVKKWAIKYKIPVLTPKNSKELSEILLFESRLNRDENLSLDVTSQSPQATSKNIDIGIVSVYGLMIPKEILSLPKYGFLNIHPSLLPKYRGSSPVQAAIVDGERETGVTLFQLDEKLDHGPIWAQKKEKILATDTAEILYQRLFAKGSDLLAYFLPNLSLLPSLTPTSQDDNKASYTRRLTRADGFLPWEFIQAALNGKEVKQKMELKFIKNSVGESPLLNVNCYLLNDFIRGLSPWPGAWSETSFNIKHLTNNKKRAKLLKSHVENGRLVLDLVQYEGEKPIVLINQSK